MDIVKSPTDIELGEVLGPWSLLMSSEMRKRGYLFFTVIAFNAQ
jgi:hypothetical protein